MSVHRWRLSEEENWIKGTGSARGGAEKVTWLVGENRGECAVFHELGAITRQSLTSDASCLKRAGSDTLVLDAIAVLLERAALEQAVLKHNKPTCRVFSGESARSMRKLLYLKLP